MTSDDNSGLVYLIVADDTEEFAGALRYAARAAAANGARIAVLHIMPDLEFSHWGSVENQVQHEQRQAAETFMSGVCDKIVEFGSPMPIVYIEQGNPHEVLLRVINNNPDISKLILGGDSHGSNPGPLVTYFSGKGMGQLSVPMTIVPGHIAPERLDDFV